MRASNAVFFNNGQHYHETKPPLTETQQHKVTCTEEPTLKTTSLQALHGTAQQENDQCTHHLFAEKRPFGAKAGLCVRVCFTTPSESPHFDALPGSSNPAICVLQLTTKPTMTPTQCCHQYSGSNPRMLPPSCTKRCKQIAADAIGSACMHLLFYQQLQLRACVSLHHDSADATGAIGSSQASTHRTVQIPYSAAMHALSTISHNLPFKSLSVLKHMAQQLRATSLASNHNMPQKLHAF